MGLYNETLNQNIDNLQVNNKLGNSGGGGESLYNYIEEEHIVGTWIDGSPVYEAIYTFSATNDANWHQFNLENIRFISFYPLPEIADITIQNGPYFRVYDCYTNYFKVMIGSGMPAIIDGKIIIRYVKTA